MANIGYVHKLQQTAGAIPGCLPDQIVAEQRPVAPDRVMIESFFDIQ